MGSHVPVDPLDSMKALEETLHYAFRSKELLRQALAHSSRAKEVNNQRLEFLGDAILGAVIADMLYTHFPQEREGSLARRHAALVCGETLVDVARDLKLGEYMLLSAGEAAAGGRDTPSNLEDALEALIGAIYLDGGFEAAQRFILPRWEILARSAGAAPKDPKTALQEWAQARSKPVPAYTLVGSVGPAHAPLFTVEVSVEGVQPVQAQAKSKRAAEMAAAAEMLDAVKQG